MLSIGKMASGQGAYYTQLGNEDYYLEGGEPPGKWWGQGAERIGFSGTVEREELRALLEGYSPDGNPLTQNAGREKRCPGWDLTFSAPKSVSVYWSQASREVRREIQEAQQAAVKAALSYLEQHATFSRLGKEGRQITAASPVVAMFEHGTSRALDPQLHTHCLFANVAMLPNGQTASLFSKFLYQHKMAAGAVYRAQLAYELGSRLGLECERKRTWFELKSVSKQICDHFSTRRKEILDKLGELGVETASAAAFAALETRKAKDMVPPREELFRTWRETGTEHGFSTRQTTALRNSTKQTDPAKAYKEALSEAVRTITEHESHFTERDLVRRTMEASQGRGLDAGFVLKSLERNLQDRSRLRPLGILGGETQYSTPEMLKAEAKLLEAAQRSRDQKLHLASSRIAERVIGHYARPRSVLHAELKHHAAQLARAARGKKTEPVAREKLRKHAATTLNAEQAEAVRYLTVTPGSIKILSGMAGTGKSITLDACREIWKRAGYKTVGAALSAKAAKGLEESSGIESCSLALLERKMKPTVSDYLKHHARQLLRAARNKPTYRLKPLSLHNTVLVIDEAGMVGTKQLGRILESAHEHGAKVVLAGDAKQLQAIEAGSPFLALSRRLGYVELTEIRRQRAEEDRELVRKLADGKAGEVLHALAERGRLNVAPTRDAAMDSLVADWSKDRKRGTNETLILAAEHRDVDELNRRCQRQQILSREVRSSHGIKVNDEFLYDGDRILFKKNSYKLGVENGVFGTVTATNSLRRRITAELDDGTSVTVPLHSYRYKTGEDKGKTAVKLGYAVTTHAAQGATVENAFILAGGSMQNRELTYVQLSRARGKSHLYVDEKTAGEKLANLEREMSTSKMKAMAHDLYEEQRPTLRLSR